VIADGNCTIEISTEVGLGVKTKGLATVGVIGNPGAGRRSSAFPFDGIARWIAGRMGFAVTRSMITAFTAILVNDKNKILQMS